GRGGRLGGWGGGGLAWQSSLGVGPPPKSIPRPPLEWIELPSIRNLLKVNSPAWPLKAMTLPSPGLAPPTLMLARLAPAKMPRVLGTGEVPLWSVPIKFPWIVHPGLGWMAWRE